MSERVPGDHERLRRIPEDLDTPTFEIDEGGSAGELTPQRLRVVFTPVQGSVQVDARGQRSPAVEGHRVSLSLVRPCFRERVPEPEARQHPRRRARLTRLNQKVEV